MSQYATLNEDWRQAEDALNSAFFKAFYEAFKCPESNERLRNWPTLAQLNARAKADAPRFVPADEALSNYERFIFETGTVPTRDNWHDLFNAFVWLTFPQAKAALNCAHMQALEADGAAGLKLRSAARDALTLFDESGIIVLSDNRDLLAHIPAFAWHKLFVQERAVLASHMLFVPFGHAVMEKMLSPYLGVVAKVILIEVGPDFFDLHHAAQIAWCDKETARLILTSDIFKSPKNLLPLPFLGVPDWDPRNKDEAFYANTNYFRAGSRTWRFSRNKTNETGLEI